ncbi:hypothetical protein FS749_013266 [Ceratobasidium sp. UAMH 11750]|nr:hypothetical protein FS749_013266 [Ceratobasidium sp. UAMH 11750]
MKMLQEHLEPNLFSPKGAYDGRKNLFTTTRLALGDNNTRTFELPMGNPRPDSDRPPRTRRVKLQLAQEINPEVLSQFQQGRHAQDNVVLTALMALNVALRHEPISKYTFNTRSFFLPAGKKAVPMGLELWPGVFQSIRPAVNSMHINIDTSTGVVYVFSLSRLYLLTVVQQLQAWPRHRARAGVPGSESGCRPIFERSTQPARPPLSSKPSQELEDRDNIP